MLALLIATALAQTTGGPGGNNPLSVYRMVYRWDAVGVPALSLKGVPPGSVPYGEPNLEPVPQGQTLTYKYCFDPNTDEGLVSGYKSPTNRYPDNSVLTSIIIAWSPSDNTTGNVKWDMYCTAAVQDSAYSPITTYTVTAAARGLADQLTFTTIATEPGAANITGFFCCSLVRDADNALDTYAGEACLTAVITEYPIDSIGHDAAGFIKN